MSHVKGHNKQKRSAPFSKFTKFVNKVSKGIHDFLGSDIGQSILAPLETALPFLTPIVKGVEIASGIVSNLTDNVNERMQLSLAPRSEASSNSQDVLPSAAGKRTALPPGVKEIGKMFTVMNAQAQPSLQTAIPTPLPDMMQPQALQLTANDMMSRTLGPVINTAISSIGFINRNGLSINQSPFIEVS